MLNSETLFKDFLSDKKPLFIGDIHSRYLNLLTLLESFPKEEYFYIFLGDINDSRLDDDQASFNFVYQLIRNLCDQNLAVLVQSNHQKKIIRFLEGKISINQESEKTRPFLKTVESLEEKNLITIQREEATLYARSSTQNEEVLKWFQDRPFYFKCFYGGVEYVAVHAYYSTSLKNPHLLNSKEKSLCIYGLMQKGERVKWWPHYQQKPFIVCGHYHTVFLSNYCAVVDSGCGEGGKLSAFSPYHEKILAF
jgi:hypothetical protein